MIHIPRIVGVNHGGPTPGILSLGILQTEPSKGLLDEIARLKSGSVIGIEFAPELIGLDSFGFTDGHHEIDMPCRHYWTKIIDACKEQGKEISYLLDFDFYKNSFTAVYETGKIKQKIFEVGTMSPEADPLFAERYRQEAIAEYLVVVQQEQIMMENIRKSVPRMVIVGMFHASHLFLKRDHDIEFGSYATDTEDEIQMELLEYESDAPGVVGVSGTITNVYKRNAKPVKNTMHDSVTRKYLAATQGRITSNGTQPDYIGTWDITCQPAGLFELFVDERRGDMFYGCVEDINGRAGISGTETGKDITFVKTYNRQAKRTSSAATEPITYSARRFGSDYVGFFTFTKDNGREVCKPFTMRKV